MGFRLFLIRYVDCEPGANFMPSQTENGIQPWWMTCKMDTWSVFFRKLKNNVSKNSVNLAMKYHQQVFAIWKWKITIKKNEKTLLCSSIVCLDHCGRQHKWSWGNFHWNTGIPFIPLIRSNHSRISIAVHCDLPSGRVDYLSSQLAGI